MSSSQLIHLSWIVIVLSASLVWAGPCPDPRDPGCCKQLATFPTANGTMVTQPLMYDPQTNKCAWPPGYTGYGGVNPSNTSTTPVAGSGTTPSSPAQPIALPKPPPMIPTSTVVLQPVASATASISSGVATPAVTIPSRNQTTLGPNSTVTIPPVISPMPTGTPSLTKFNNNAQRVVSTFFWIATGLVSLVMI